MAAKASLGTLSIHPAIVQQAHHVAVRLCAAHDNAPLANEKFDLDIFATGQRLSALLWQGLSRT